MQPPELLRGKQLLFAVWLLACGVFMHLLGLKWFPSAHEVFPRNYMPSVEDHCYDVVHKGGNHFRPQDSPKDGILAWQLFVVWIMWGASLMAKQRLQFDFDETAVKEIDELREATAMPNRAELIRQALRFLQWTLDETRKGGTLLIEKDGKVREVIFPFWTVSSGSRSSEGE